MAISIVIPNYNGKKLLESNLGAIVEAIFFYKKEYKDDIEILVLDDCSKDGSLEYLKEQKKIIEKKGIPFLIFENKKNYGFAYNANKGVSLSKGEIIILLNTDVRPHKDFLKPLITHFDDPNIFAVGCLDESIEGNHTVLRGRGVGTWKRGFLLHKRGEVNKTNTLWVSGGSSAFRKSIWQRLKGFNEIYSPFYWEDIDLSYRAQKLGYKILFEPTSKVIHEHEKGAIKKHYSEFFIQTIAFRNQFLFVWINISDTNLILLHFLWLPYHIVKALLRKDSAFFNGFFKSLILLPKVIQLRFRYSKQFIEKDITITEQFIK